MNDLCNSCQFDTFTKKCQKGWERNGLQDSCDDYEKVIMGNKTEVSRHYEQDFDIHHEYRKLEEENTELKAELEKWKSEWQEQVVKANDEGYARTLQGIEIEKLKKENAELIAQNEKMRCCGNCKNCFVCKIADKSGLTPSCIETSYYKWECI